MRNSGRFLIALLAFGLSFNLVAGLVFSLFASGAPAAFRTVTGLACGLLVAIAFWRATASPASGLGPAMLKGSGLLGLIGFIGGYVGPMILSPESNQGPLLGIFITGPIGVVIGAVAGAAWWKLKPAGV